MLCGGDLIETFSVPGLWQESDITAIVRDYGLVVITREGSNPEKYVYDHDILHQYRVSMITIHMYLLQQISFIKSIIVK